MPTLSEVQSASEPPAKPSRAAVAVLEKAKPVANYYCLDNAHDPRLLTENRFFYFDPDSTDCPTCPVCQKQVSAQFAERNAKGQPQIPRSLLALADRLGERV